MHSDLLRGALDSIEDGVLIVAGDGQVLYANTRLRVMWGMPGTWYR